MLKPRHWFVASNSLILLSLVIYRGLDVSQNVNPALAAWLQPLIDSPPTTDTPGSLPLSEHFFPSQFFSIRALDPMPVVVRECYKDLLERLEDLTSVAHFHKTGNIIQKLVITGTPGIGKSHIVFSLLPHLLNTDRLVAVEKSYLNKVSVFFKQQGKLVALVFHLKDSPTEAPLFKSLFKRGDFIFRDPEEHEGQLEGFNLPASEVLVSSPLRVGFLKFLKGMHDSAQLVLPPHTLSELAVLAAALPKVLAIFFIIILLLLLFSWI